MSRHAFEKKIFLKLTDQSRKSQMLLEAFGIEQEKSLRTIISPIELNMEGITFITGHSGSGKSSLLREIGHFLKDYGELSFEFTDEPVVDQINASLKESVYWLSQFGLGEAWILTGKPEHLSEGQKYRLALAILLWEKPKNIIVDEFLSVLDRQTAKIVAMNFSKLVRKYKINAFIASAHGDLSSEIAADQEVRLDLCGSQSIYQDIEPHNVHSEIEVIEGEEKDFHALSHFHYRKEDDQWIDWDQNVDKILVTKFRGLTVGVAVYTYVMPPQLNTITFVQKINSNYIRQERIIIHPTFRGIGLSSLLTPKSYGDKNYIIIQSALGKYFPFSLKSGFVESDSNLLKTDPAQIKLEDQLIELLARAIENKTYHSQNNLIEAFSGINGDDLKKIKLSTVPAFLASQLNFVRFLAEYAKIQVREEEFSLLRKIYTSIISGSDLSLFAKLVEMSLPFEMATFVKKIEDEK